MFVCDMIIIIIIRDNGVKNAPSLKYKHRYSSAAEIQFCC